MKKPRRKNRNAPNKEEKGKLFSSLDDHKRMGKKLMAPFLAALGDKMALASWRDTGLHEFLWAALIRANLGQTEALRIFRQIVVRAKNSGKNYKETFISHSVLSALSDDVFDELFQPILNHSDAIEILPALLFFDCLPDRHHWARHLKQPTGMHSDYLVRAVGVCLDHQSQESTDIRWMKVAYFAIVAERLHFPAERKDRVEELRLYPDYGDQRTVRPSIRALEMSLRGPDEKTGLAREVPQSLEDKVPRPWHENFWRECFQNTPCMPPRPLKPPRIDVKDYQDQFFNLLQKLSEHFIASLKSTEVDARRDGAFGLAMYSIVLSFGLIHVHQRAEARIILRSIVEVFITLRFLTHHDNPTLWRQFRTYGTGQAKLAFLKNLRSEDLPDFLRLEELETYANEDMWQELQDIDLKSWANRNLRSMAEEAGVKNIYDKYYDWSSGYVHGGWASIRDTAFTTCLNPLHRFHRIPFIPRFDMPSALPDAAKLVNSVLDVIDHLFSSFKPRFKHPKTIDKSSDEQKNAEPRTTSSEE